LEPEPVPNPSNEALSEAAALAKVSYICSGASIQLDGPFFESKMPNLVWFYFFSIEFATAKCPG
jgi:hypothetical protein